MYSSKHYTRADRNLKRSFYVYYVLSQMTLLEDKKLAKDTDEKPDERKRDRKLKEKKEAKAKKSTNSAKTTNLFAH